MSLDELKPLITWLQAHPSLAGLVIGLISLAESLAVIGTLIPGTLVMSAVGTLLGAGILPWLEVMLWAIGGAIVGDGLSYWLGYYYHEQIRAMWPFNRLPGVLKSGEAFFLRHGGKSVFFGRFIGPIRPIIPVVAGMMNMSPLRFTLANVASALGWAPAYMLPGILLGALSMQLAPHTATRILVMLIVVCLGVWLGFECLRYMINFILRHLNFRTSRLWLYIKETPSLQRLHAFLQHPEKPHSHHSLNIALFGITIGGLLLALSMSIFLHYDSLINANYTVLFFARGLRLLAIDRIALVFSFMSTWPVLISLFSVVLIGLLYTRCWQIAGHWIANALLATITCLGLKTLTHLPRPNGLAAQLEGWSFPSLNLTLFVALLTYFAVIIDHQTPHHRRPLYVLISVLISLAALTQLYFNLHWLSDVIGSILLGIFCTLLITLSYRQRRSKKLKPARFLLMTSLVFLAAWGIYTYTAFHRTLQRYSVAIPNYSMKLQDWWGQSDTLLNRLLTQNPAVKLAQIPNLQWAGRLTDIEWQLTQHGWQIVPKANLAIILNRIAAHDRSQQLPLLPKFYLGRKPVLTMTKQLNTTPAQIIILRIWDPHVRVDNSLMSLWIARVDYHQPWDPDPLHTTQPTLPDMPAWKFLLADLFPLHIKSVTISIKCAKKSNLLCRKQILLIRPRK